MRTADIDGVCVCVCFLFDWFGISIHLPLKCGMHISFSDFFGTL